MKRGISLLVATFALAPLAGCGGDDEPAVSTVTSASGASGASLSTLSKEQFIEQADAICEENSAALANLDTSDDEDAASQELEYAESLLDQLRTLAPPEDDQETLDEFFATLEDEIDLLERKQLAAERSDEAAASEAD